jgi:hypothetical protein
LRVANKVIAEHFRRTAAWQQQRDQHLNCGCLARTIRPEQTEQLSAFDFEVDAADGLNFLSSASTNAGARAVSTLEIIDFNYRHSAS